MKITQKVLLVLISGFLIHCSTGSKAPEDLSFGLETIAILGTNDIHGSLLPASLKTREKSGVQSIPYEAGGVATLASYIKSLRLEFGTHMIWLDAGDEFQGSIESNLEYGAPMVRFFNTVGLNAAAVGNHEFDFGLPTLKSRMSEAQYPYLAANITDKNTGALAVFPNTYRHFVMKAGNLRIGILGLSTLDTPTTTRAENVKTLKFENLRETAVRGAEELRNLGAQVVLLTAHVGLKCDGDRVGGRSLMRKPKDPHGICGEKDEMVELLQSLPPGTIDAVVSGHSHQVVHQWVAGVPVIQGGAFGRYFNVIYLTYDWHNKKVLPEQSRIEGPVPVCAQVFKNQGDCNGDRPAPKNGRGRLVPVHFHGQTITPDSEVDALLDETRRKSGELKHRVLGTAIRPIEHVRMGESEAGNLAADAIRKTAGTDFAYVNSGGIRDSLESGPIKYGDIFRMLPFDNSIAVLKLNAKELKLFLQVAESGSRGFGSVSGLHLRLIDPSHEAPFEDLNGDGRYELWKLDRLLELTLSNGEALDPNKFYTLATIDFLVTGGDDLKWVFSRIPPERIEIRTNLLVRDGVVKYVEDLKIVNSLDKPLVDRAHPRFKFEVPQLKKKVRIKARSRHKKSVTR